MAGLTRRISAIKTGLASRLATPASRFRSAVIAGFTLTAFGVATVGAGTTGYADDIFSGLASLFGVPAYPQYSQPTSAAAPRRMARQVRRHAPKLTVHLASTHGDDGTHRVRGGLSMCVRTCDGFAFPVGTYHGESDRAAHEATCQSECPGAQTTLYVLPSGSDTIGDAIQVQSGHIYSQMPAAFHYTTFLSETCSCHPREGNRISSLLHDFTLRRGDAVMTPTGFKVFHGGGAHFPYKQKDFVALSSSKDVREHQRATFHAIERASRPAPATVAQRPVPAGTAAKTAAPGLEKQAALTP